MSLGTRFNSLSLTITSGTQTSNSSRTGFKATPVAVIFPAAMTGTGITFEVTDDGTNWYPLHNSSGTLITITKVNGVYHTLNTLDFAGVQEVRIKSSGNEDADRVFKLICRPMYQ